MNLPEATDAREKSRTKLLELRAALFDLQETAKNLARRVSEVEPAIRAEERRFVELTTKVTQLLNADVSGLTGRRAGTDPPPLPTHSELTPQPEPAA